MSDEPITLTLNYDGFLFTVPVTPKSQTMCFGDLERALHQIARQAFEQRIMTLGSNDIAETQNNAKA